MTRKISSITEEEINKIFKISEIERKNGGSIFRKRRNSSEIILENLYDEKIIISNEGIFYKNGIPCCKKTPIPNCSKVSQYLIDQGFRFEYNI